MRFSALSNAGRKFFNAKPPTYSKSLILNVLGMQFFITFFYSFLYFIKGKRTVPTEFYSYFDDLEQNGFAIVNDFLPPTAYALVCREFEALLPHFQNFDTYTKVNLPHVERLDITDPKVKPELQKIFLEHPLIISIAQAFLRRRKFFDVKAYLTRISILNEGELGEPQDGGTTNIHIDAPMRVLKFFYFLEPVNQENGTLEYARGTNRRSLRILFLEYVHSVRYALNKWRPHPTGQYSKGRPWVEVSEQEVERYNLKTEPVIVPKNTLVILNPGGYHRRGVMLRPGDRKAIEINFRNVDTLKNYFKAFLS